MSKSLSAVLDTVNEHTFYDIPIPQKTRKAMAALIMSRRDKPGAYAHMYAPFNDADIDRFRLFTGEIPAPRSASHIMGEESIRSLILLDGKSKVVRESIAKASVAVNQSIEECSRKKYRHPSAFFCCPKCTCGMWRNLAVGGLPRAEERLHNGMKALRGYRDGKGGWRQFPFYYTLLTLLDIGSPLARAELKYASGRCKRELGGTFVARNKYSRRRQDVLERALGVA